ncbi:unnamed protein product [Nippostrongylus brasiliensis]|uniref:Uncharacterized protein n=1 Tax=Nippostrongylus brasiliensis TaxID=27835 RepID=A0A0N4XPD9_NIPBR|nr:unnamed protein product [Nippostrongylus brasiliensis]
MLLFPDSGNIIRNVFFADDSVSSADEESLVVIKPRKRVDAMILKPREVCELLAQIVILSSYSIYLGVAMKDSLSLRSSRNRMKPVRRSRTLKGVTEVVIKEKRWLKVRTANSAVAVERERAWKRRQEARERKEQRIQELHNRHRRGVDLNVTVDSIVTSSDEEDYD